MKPIDSIDWLIPLHNHGEVTVRLFLLDQDVASVQLSFADYENSKKELIGDFNALTRELAQHKIFHNAKVFVSAVRRVGRLVEAMSANRNLFGTAANDIKLAWRKKKAEFDKYIDPRNAIEHIDGEIKGKESWSVVNLKDDILKVTEKEEHAVEISFEVVEMVVGTRNEIVQAILKAMA